MNPSTARHRTLPLRARPFGARRVGIWAAAVLLAACSKGPTPLGNLVDASVTATADDGPLEAAVLDRHTTLARGPLATLVERRLASARASDVRPEALLRAAHLAERLYRETHKESDGQRALAAYTEAANDRPFEGTCEAARDGARLEGELASDGRKTYVALFRLLERAKARNSLRKQANSDASGCIAALTEDLAAFRALRPSDAELDAARAALALEGIAIDLSTKGQAHITRVEHTVGEETARIVVYLDKPVAYKVADFALGNALETTLEFEATELSTGHAEQKKLTGIATGLRLEETKSGARIAIGLSGKAYRKVFHLTEPYRVVLDLARTAPSNAARRAVEKVVIDAGHGGSDPGAIGPTGLHEKDVTLDLSKRVATGLVARGIRVFFTREDDSYVALEERTARANAVSADLFLSIHCNAAENRSRHGIESYVLDTASSDMASRLAARENATTEKATRELSEILADMRMSDGATRSHRFGQLLQKSALASLSGSYADVVDGGVKNAGFYVLVGARMPGVLFETSYISNETEERRLSSDAYKDRLADAMVNAVLAYRQGK